MTAAHLITLGASYLVGTISWSWLAARLVKGVDLRTVGSGNLGATNAGRLLGRRWAVAIYALDMAKGLGPTLLAARLDPGDQPPPLAVVAGLATVLGHVFPFYLGFRGGKGVATASGVLLALHPPSALLSALTWALTLLAFRWVSLASVLAAAALPIFYYAFGRGEPGSGWRLALFATVALLVIALHRSNLRRLLAGTERKIGGLRT